MPAAYMEFNGYACIAPGVVADEMQRLRDAGAFLPDDWEGYANSFCDCRGVDPSYGYLVVPAAAVTQVSSAASTGLKIIMKFGDRQWTKLKVDWSKKVSPTNTAEQGYYFVRVVDQRYVLASSFVGSRFNLVTSYDPPPPGNSPSVKGTFRYDSETTPDGSTTVPYTWKQLFDKVWNVPDVPLDQTAVAPYYPTYVPQDLDWRYTTHRDALEALLQWCNFTIEPDPLGTYKLVRCRNQDNPLFGSLATYSNVVVNNRWPRYREPGEPVTKFALHFEIINPLNSATKEYEKLDRTPVGFSVSKATTDLRLPCVSIPGASQSTYPINQWPANVADAFIATQTDYFNQFPPTELTLSGYCFGSVGILTLKPGAFIERVTYFDLGDGPFTHVLSICKRKWTPQPISLDHAGGEGDSNFAIVSVDSNVTPATSVFLATPLLLVWGAADYINDKAVVSNQFFETLPAGSKIPVWSKRGTSVWYPDRGGGSSGSVIVRFELLEDKHAVDYARLATLVDNEGNTLTGEENQIYVIDSNHKFVGYGPYEREEGDDPEPGFRGTAFLLLTDYFNGIPGYSIIEMESVARWNDGRLTTDFTRFSDSSTGRCEVAFNFWGNAPNGKKPKTQKETVLGGGSDLPDGEYQTVQFTDPWKLASLGLNRGTRIRIQFIETTETWVLVSVKQSSQASNFVVGKLKTDLTVEMEKVFVVVTEPTNDFQVDGEIEVDNPIDLLRTTQTKTVYEHVGNENSGCLVQVLSNKFRLETVQPPNRRPVAPGT